MDPKLLSGTLDLMILETLAPAPSYGYEITQAVLSQSSGQIELKEGSLYPALHRLERGKFLKSFWQEFEGRRRKYYQITAAGLKLLHKKRNEWTAFSDAVNGVLGVKRSIGLNVDSLAP